MKQQGANELKGIKGSLKSGVELNSVSDPILLNVNFAMFIIAIYFTWHAEFIYNV